MLRFAWQAAEFSERNRVSDERYDEQPRFAVHYRQDPPAEDEADQQIDDNGEKEFHRESLVPFALCASRVEGNRRRPLAGFRCLACKLGSAGCAMARLAF